MKALSILLLFFSSLAYSQSYISEHFYRDDPKYFDPTGDLESYEVTGKVKKITAKTIYSNTKNWNKLDSIDKLNTDILEFTPNGKLESESKKYYNSDIVYLNEKYFFDELGQPITKEEYHWKDFLYIEKFVYHNNHLIERWIKTTYQTDFFLKERYTYNDKNQLVREEDLNNNLRISETITSCSMSSDYDTITDYLYAPDGSISKTLRYSYVYDSNSTTAPDESQFKLYRSQIAEFLNNKKIKEIDYGFTFPDYTIPLERTTFYDYDENGNLIYEVTQVNNRKDYKPFTRYIYNQKKLIETEQGYSDKKTHTKKYHNQNGNLIRIEKIEKNKTTESREFNNNGFLIQGNKNGITCDYKIEYDSHGNWIKYSTYIKDVLIKEKQRIIEYYD